MIYVASSWKNPLYDGVIQILHAANLPLYDFKRPGTLQGKGGFHWSEIDGGWRTWTTAQYRDNLCHPLAEEGFTLDMDALKACDRLVLVLPSGKSSHLELGYAIGTGKETFILMLEPQEPELMYKAADHICLSMMELLAALGVKD